MSCSEGAPPPSLSPSPSPPPPPSPPPMGPPPPPINNINNNNNNSSKGTIKGFGSEKEANVFELSRVLNKLNKTEQKKINPKTANLRCAVFMDSKTSNDSIRRFNLFSIRLEEYSFYLHPVDANDIANNILQEGISIEDNKNENEEEKIKFDVLVFAGGLCWQVKELMEDANPSIERLYDFLANGGGYFGTCCGGWLTSPDFFNILGVKLIDGYHWTLRRIGSCPVSLLPSSFPIFFPPSFFDDKKDENNNKNLINNNENNENNENNNNDNKKEKKEDNDENNNINNAKEIEKEKQNKEKEEEKNKEKEDDKIECEMYFRGGPIFEANDQSISRYLRDYLPPATILGLYDEDMTEKKYQSTPSSMIGKGAIISGQFGKGRVIAFGPHPEASSFTLAPLIANSLLWAARKH